MKKLILLINVFVIAGITTSANSSTNVSSDQLFIYKLPKNLSVKEPVAKFATAKSSWTLSRKAVVGRIPKHVLNICKDCRTFFVEYPQMSTPSIKGEVFREGRIAFAVTPKSVDAHALHKNNVRVYVREIGNLKSYSPSAEIPSRSTAHIDAPVTVPPVAIDVATLERVVGVLSGERPFRFQGKDQKISDRGSSDGKTLSRQFLRLELEKLGYVVTEEKYSSGTNVVATRDGATSRKYVLVTAHLDSVFNAGADDDASGVATSVAILEALSKEKPSVGIKLVAFDEEERGLVGSRALADDWAKSGQLTSIIGVVNIEMTGYDADNDGAVHAIHCNENTSKDIADMVAASIKAQTLDLNIISACTNRSDHASFWRHNVPAIVVSQNFFGSPPDANPCYHRSCDKIDKFNFSYAERLANALNGVVWNMIK